MRNAIHFLGGSVAVYLLMAACSAGTKSRPEPEQHANAGGAATVPDAGATGAATVATTSGAPASGGSAQSTGGILGEVMDPIPDAEAAPATSGTRLRARYLTGEDGSRQFVGWRDMQRNEDCSFLRAEDGVTRCLPGYSFTSSYFADAGCTQPLLVTATVATACGGVTPVVPKYAADITAAGCGVTKLYAVGAAVAPAMIYIGSAATCTGSAPPATYAFYSTTPAPASGFIAATEQVE
jgi:hypothetical protein